MKFGGASVATPDHFDRIASIIIERMKEYKRVIVVVSAMGKTTDQLIDLAKQVHPNPPSREYDMLVSVGERISISLLAMALASRGCEAISFTGSQSGIITTDEHSEARIVDVRPDRLIPCMDKGQVVIVAGFQGVSRNKQITTLGRGGSDTSAVALAVPFRAKVEFYKDVPGIFSKDPKCCPDAQQFLNLTYDQALEIAKGGAKVLHPRAIELAKKNALPLHVLSFQEQGGSSGTVIKAENPPAASTPLFEGEEINQKVPEITTVFDSIQKKLTHPLYYAAIKEALGFILPDGLFELRNEKTPEMLKKKFHSLLPLIKATPAESSPSCMSFYCLFKYRANAFKFFFELVSQWLVPGRRLDVGLVYAVDFRIPELGDDVYTVCEVMLRLETQEDLEMIERNFPIIETEAILGVDSAYYARKILEIKGMSPDLRTALIHQYMANLLKRLPNLFSKDLFTEMQHILVLCNEDFKAGRTVRHLSRLISTHYAFRKNLLAYIKENPGKRRLVAKLFKAEVNFPSEKKEVLCLVVGLNFIREKEVLEQRHLMTAIRQYVPKAEAIDQTFFSNRKVQEPMATLYLEIEKNDGTSFTKQELDLLKYKFPDDLQNYIARLTLPVFMPRNEEEIMRNVLSLVHQIKYVRDIPQVFISFDEQTERNLIFTVIVVRLLNKEGRSVQEMIKNADSFLKYLHDRTKVMGVLRKKYPKEATVFRVKFPKDKFLRGDHSIDLYKARQAVVNELSRILGEFRDFNGGMISKQNELIDEVQKLLAAEGVKYSQVQLDNFFYSIAPVIMRTVLEPHAFKTLFQMNLEAQKCGVPKGEKVVTYTKHEPEFTYYVMAAHHRSILDELSKPLFKFHQSGSDLVQGYAKRSGLVTMGYIFRCNDIHKQAAFRALLESQNPTFE